MIGLLRIMYESENYAEDMLKNGSLSSGAEEKAREMIKDIQQVRPFVIIKHKHLLKRCKSNSNGSALAVIFNLLVLCALPIGLSLANIEITGLTYMASGLGFLNASICMYAHLKNSKMVIKIQDDLKYSKEV